MNRLAVINTVGGSGHGRNAKFARRINDAVKELWAVEGLEAAQKPNALTTNIAWHWSNRLYAEPLPAEYVRPAVHAARALGVDLDQHDLRPDIYGQAAA